MNDFTLIDLVSQREAVRELLRGRSKTEIVAWLSARGELSHQRLESGEVFRFRSTVGREAILFFDGDEFVFVGDHFTFK